MQQVYISAPFAMLPEARELAARCLDAGIASTSTWLATEGLLNEIWARVDLADVARCDVLVALNPPGWSNAGTGGRHVELGFALALHKPVVLLGVRSNIFHYLREVVIVTNVGDAIAAVKAAGRC